MKYSPKGGKNPNQQKQVIAPPAEAPTFSFTIGPTGERELIIAGKVIATGLAAYFLAAALVAAAAPVGA